MARSADRPRSRPRRPPPPDVPISFTLRVGLYLLLADGIAALYLGDFLETRGVALVALILGACFWADLRGLRLDGQWVVVRALVVLAAALSAVDVLYLAETVLDGLVRLLLFLVVYKLLTQRTVAETRTVSFLALFMLIASAVSAFGVGFLGVVVAFTVLVIWVALYQNAALEAAPAPGRVVLGGPRVSSGSLLGLAGAAAAGVLLLASGLFIVLPRVGLAALPLRARMGQMVSGFSERVELGDYGSILTNEAVAMRVQILGDGDPMRFGPLRWRGIALDEFDGRTWSVRHPRRIRIVRPSGGAFEVSGLQGSGVILRQEILLEPFGAEAVFAAPHALRFAYPANVVAVDDMGSLSAMPSRGRIAYQVESELELPTPLARHRRAAPLDDEARRRYLQLPLLSDRLRALVSQVTAGAQSPAEAASRLNGFLSREFRYTLTLEKVSDLDPLEEFLFVRRAGHCEYFAAALAVMLRAVGIPARVVNGFQQGEWNPLGRYFIVRLRDAHSWVEAYLPNAGWVTLDPSPRALADPPRLPSTVFLYLDMLRLSWNRYVINWSLRDQVGMALFLHGRAVDIGPALREAVRARAQAAGVWVVLAVTAVTAVAVWRRHPAGRRRARAPIPDFYRRALRVVARRGLRPGAGETAREFGGRVAGLGPVEAVSFGRLTQAYERARFGGQLPTPPERQGLDGCLAELAGRGTAPPRG
jgi:protein-glutamine gamma-glutamyltransferase